MSTLAIVVSIIGNVWAVAADGTRRILKSGDKLAADENLIMDDGARVDLDFGNNQQISLLGEQEVSVAQRTDMLREIEGLEPLQTDDQPLLPANGQNNNEEHSGFGHGFVHLVRIGELVESDGMSAVTLVRIQEILRPFNIILDIDALPVRLVDQDGRQVNDEGGNTETGVKLEPLKISINQIAEDDIINAAEALVDINVSGVVGGGAVAGNAIQVIVNGKEYLTTVNADGSTWEVLIPGSELAQDSNVQATVSSVEANGQPVSESTNRFYAVDTETPSISLELIGAGPDGIYNESEIINGKVPSQIDFDPSTQPGDSIVVTDGNGVELLNRPVTQADIDNNILVFVLALQCSFLGALQCCY